MISDGADQNKMHTLRKRRSSEKRKESNRNTKLKMQELWKIFPRKLSKIWSEIGNKKNDNKYISKWKRDKRYISGLKNKQRHSDENFKKIEKKLTS